MLYNGVTQKSWTGYAYFHIQFVTLSQIESESLSTPPNVKCLK